METTNAIYGSGMGVLHAPTPAAPKLPAGAASLGGTARELAGELPNLPHLRQTNYPYKPRYLPQVFSSQRISPTKTIVFEKPLGSTATLGATASVGATTKSASTTTRTSREGRFASTEPVALSAVYADKQVLRVTAYTQEGVPESPEEAARHRLAVICYHLADGTIEINEPREDNSGLMQGPVLRRHRVPRFPAGVPGVERPAAESGADHEFFDWRDLIVGTEINIYGRTYHIVDADAFTRDWYASKGVDQCAAEPIPSDPVAEKLARAKESGGKADTGHGKVMFPAKLYQEARLGKFIRDPVARHKFQMHDGKVLKFDCVWDDSASEYGDVHHLVMQYYLSDDNAEVRIVHSNNNGRDPVPSLLRKGPLPKDWARARDCTPSERPELFIQPKDLQIGKTIDVYGRKLVIRACDPWTRDWYASDEAAHAYGAAPQPDNTVEVDAAPAARAFVAPPHNGIGSEEDSLQSCFTFNVKPLRKDFTKWARNDGVVYRFHARLLSDNVLDARRRFTIACFPSDDSMAIYEPPVRNSGFKGGVFLKRNKHRKADGTPFVGTDFAPGRVVAVYAHKFTILDADAFTRSELPHLADAASVHVDPSDKAYNSAVDATAPVFADAAALNMDTTGAAAAATTGRSVPSGMTSKTVTFRA